jgi:hypothetical protein
MTPAAGAPIVVRRVAGPMVGGAPATSGEAP